MRHVMSSTEVSIEHVGSRPTVHMSRTVPFGRTETWRRLTDPEELRTWFPSEIIMTDGEWRVGSRLEFRFPPAVLDLTLTGEVLEYTPGAALAFTWGDEQLSFELRASGPETTLVLRNEVPREAVARNAAGWMQCLDRLEGLGTPEGSWRAHFERFAAAFSPTLGEQVGPPDGYKGA